MHNTMRDRIIYFVSMLVKGTAFVLGLKAVPLLALVNPESKTALTAAFVFAAASILKDLLFLIGDYVDNWKLDGSFQKKLKLPLILLAGLGLMLMGTSCGSVQGLSDTRLMLAKAGVQTAQIALATAGAVLLERMNDPDTPAWQLQAASRGLDLAAKQLADAEARYAKEQARRDLLETTPPLTSGKTAVDVVP